MVKVIIQTEDGEQLLQGLTVSNADADESDVHLAEEIKDLLLINFDVKETT